MQSHIARNSPFLSLFAGGRLELMLCRYFFCLITTLCILDSISGKKTCQKVSEVEIVEIRVVDGVLF